MAVHDVPVDPAGELLAQVVRRDARTAQLDAALTRLGYDAADLGTVDQALRCIDGALTHLMRVARCCADEADRAAWRRWPKSMAAEADHADAEDPW